MLHFSLCPIALVRSARIVRRLAPPSAQMVFRMPPRIVTPAHIFCDVWRYHPIRRVAALRALWRERASHIVPPLRRYCAQRGIALGKEYRCFVTFYGPYGFYDLPRTIYVSVANDRSEEFLLETALHELLHIILRTVGERFCTHIDEERAVDALFRALWGDVFPNYEVQDNPPHT